MRLPKKMSGSSKTVTEWNAMVDYLASIEPKQSFGTKIKRTTRGTFHSVDKEALAGAATGDDNLVWL